MERFVRLIVGGGVVLLCGLWIGVSFDPWSTPWLIGVVLSFLGAGGLFGGIAREIEV